MATKRRKESQKNRAVRDLRDQTVIAKAMMGMKTQDIADDVGVRRETVSAILNSDQVKEKIKQIDQKLASGIEDAITTVLESVKVDYKAARDLLKNYGSMKETVDLHHNFPVPTVIQRLDGTQIVLGTEHDIKEEEEG